MIVFSLCASLLLLQLHANSEKETSTIRSWFLDYFRIDTVGIEVGVADVLKL